MYSPNRNPSELYYKRHTLLWQQVRNNRAEERKVFGGSGNDLLYGNAGEDALNAGPGNATIYSEGDGEGDVVDCGSGTDTVMKNGQEQLDRYVGCERFAR
jgi:Ca2+-binding RTX toxin-like protein